MIRLLKNIILLIVAISLLLSVGTFGLIYTLMWSIFNFTKTSFLKYWGDLLYIINVGIDKIGNVLLGTFMNHFAVTKLQYPFGKIDDTISYALAMNIDFLSDLGQFIANILEFIDPGHLQNSLNKKI